MLPVAADCRRTSSAMATIPGDAILLSRLLPSAHPLSPDSLSSFLWGFAWVCLLTAGKSSSGDFYRVGSGRIVPNSKSCAPKSSLTLGEQVREEKGERWASAQQLTFVGGEADGVGVWAGWRSGQHWGPSVRPWPHGYEPRQGSQWLRPDLEEGGPDPNESVANAELQVIRWRRSASGWGEARGSDDLQARRAATGELGACGWRRGSGCWACGGVGRRNRLRMAFFRLARLRFRVRPFASPFAKDQVRPSANYLFFVF